MKEKIKDLFTKNLGLKFLSLGISCFLWLVVVTVDDPVVTKVFSQIPVQLINADEILEQGNVFEVVNNTDTISISVKAKRTIVDHLSKDNFKAVADVSLMEEGRVAIDVKSDRLADRIDSITFRNRNYVEIKVEKKIDKQLEVEVVPVGNVADGYIIGAMIPNRKTIRISGPESVVERVQGARVNVDVDGLMGDTSANNEVKLVDEIGTAITNERIETVVDTMDVEIKIYEMVQVSLNVGYSGVPADGYAVASEAVCEPNQVVVAGEGIQVADLTTITIPSTVLDVSNATDDCEVIVNLLEYLPSGVVLADSNTFVTAKVSVQPLKVRAVEVPVSNITAINVPDNMTATVGGLGEVVVLNIRGLENDLDNLEPVHITGVVDCSKLDLPTDGGQLIGDGYDATVDFVYPEGIYDSGNSIVSRMILQYKVEE